MRTSERIERQREYKARRAKFLKVAPPPELTHERLLEVVHYDAETGKFTRLGRPGKRTDLAGNLAGGPTSDGYIRIAVDDRRYRAHRLAWFYMTGKWPEVEIDHINGIRTDNRFANLREATSTINKENRREANKNSKVGLLGVSHRNWRFAARIFSNGKEVHLGMFDTAELAHDAYVEAKRRMHVGGVL